MHIIIRYIAALGIAFTFASRGPAEGIPEPSLIFYGTIRNTADNNLRLTYGTLTWTVRETLPNGSFRTNTFLALVGNYAGFSYVLEAPAETLISGPVSSNVLQLTGSTNRFDWLSVIYDSGTVRTQLSLSVSTQATFFASSRQRGRIEQIDFTVGIPCVDEDGNGLCDEWERRYCFAPGGCGSANDDWDGDGLTNLQEYRIGSNPNDANSGLLFTHSEALTNNIGTVVGIKVEWESVDGRAYGLYRTANLLSILKTNLPVAPDTRLIATNLSATPPRNVFLDTNAPPPGPYFYRLRLE